MGYALRVKLSGDLELIDLPRAPKLEALQGWVDGPIEQVPMIGHKCLRLVADRLESLPLEPSDEVTAFCHEEGKLEGRPVNRLATKMWHQGGYMGDVLVGDVVFVWGSSPFMAEL